MARWRPEISTSRDRELPMWRQALEGIGLVTVAALVAIGVGALMSVVVAWLF